MVGKKDVEIRCQPWLVSDQSLSDHYCQICKQFSACIRSSDMKKTTCTQDKYERNTAESGLSSRNSKGSHKRKSRAILREWQNTEDQLDEKGIEDYKRNKCTEYCSQIYIVIPTGEDKCASQDTLTTIESEKALVSKSEYDITRPDSDIFNKDSIGRYLDEVQSIKSVGGRNFISTRSMDSRKNNRTGSLQKRHVLRQTNRESSVPSVKNLEPDTIIPREESFVFQNLVNKTRLKPRSGGKHSHRAQSRHVYNNDDTSTECSRNNEQVTCPSHIYTFSRGLVPSREVQNLEFVHTPHFLPPVVADRIGNISEQKHYRLSRDKGGKSLTQTSFFLDGLYTNDQSLEQKVESKPAVYKEFSAETVIPAVYGGSRYFDFQGYIEFLCKERNLRKNSARSDRQLDEWGRQESSSWLNNLGDVLVKDVFDYGRILDIKGSRMKLDENRAQMRLQTKPISEPPHHFVRDNSKYVTSKPQKALKVTHLRNRKPKEKPVYIERLPSKFHFTLPGRPPSSDDSGFAE